MSHVLGNCPCEFEDCLKIKKLKRLKRKERLKLIKKEGEINEFYFLQSIFGLTKWKKEWIEEFWKIKALGLTY